MTMRKILAASGLCATAALTVTFGAGSTANVTWVAPTQYTDGSALPASDIDHYTLSWAPATGQSGPTGSMQIAGTASTATVPVPCGSVTFTMTVTTGASAKYPNATSSATSGVPYVTGITCAPNPPTGLAVH